VSPRSTTTIFPGVRVYTGSPTPATPPDGPLANTSSDVAEIAAVGAALVAGGVVTHQIGRRRRSRHS
jgi:hypothetical protein